MSSNTKKSRKLTDQAARDRICNDLDTTLVVEAAAGTGKTSALVGRILAGIKSGRVKLVGIVAVTFTDFAAGELKLRLRTEIERARQDSNCSAEAQHFLMQALSELEEARIGTIHSFCSDILRERPVEAGIDPLFEVASDERAKPLFNFAFDRWFERQLAEPGEAVRRILRRPPRRDFTGRQGAPLVRRRRDDGPKRLLRSAAWELINERDFTAPWRRLEHFDRVGEINAILAEMKELGEWSAKGDPEQWFTKSLNYLKHYIEEIERTEEITGRDYDGIEARLFNFLSGWKAKHYVAYFHSDGFPKEDLKQRRNALIEKVQEFVRHSGAELAPMLREDLSSLIEDYELLKERAGYVDFLDLLVRVRNLLRDNQSIRNELQSRFTHIFVDEFQDTDPLQAEILLLLAASDPAENNWRQSTPLPGKLFIVGDPKQSIYRFRRADVRLYEEVKQCVLKSGGALVQLNVSFRSVPELQTIVNAAFTPVMNGESPTQAQYVPLAPYRQGVSTQPAVIALPVPQPYGDFGKVVAWKLEASQPTAVAAFIDWLVNKSGWTVGDRANPNVRVPIQPRHICLLFRRFRSFNTDVTRKYVRALEDRRLSHLLVGGSSFHTREEVEAVRNALSAIERPEDELAVYATLRGPLFAFTDAQLLALKSCCSHLHPFRPLPEDLPKSLSEIPAALEILRNLHRGRNWRPVAETISKLLAYTRAHAGFANWSTGEQALANLMRLTDMARRLERNGSISFRSFIDWLDDQAENGEAGDAPIMEEGVDGVRMMTVHKAKGLEFPVVILTDMTAKDSRDPARWVDQQAGLCTMKLAGCIPIELQEHEEEERRLEKEEAARILYVASTRARDLLVVCAVGDERYDGWLATLNPVLYPEVEQSFNPESRDVPGCPHFGQDNVVSRPAKAHRKLGSVSPGLHKPEVGNQKVVWWDPSLLDLEVQSQTRSRLTSLLTADEEGVHSKQGILAHEEWQKERARNWLIGETPEWQVVTATEHAAAKVSEMKEDDLATLVSVETLEIDFTRPHGLRFGTLVHAILSTVALDSETRSVQELAHTQGRILGAPEEEINAATETVVRALKHPILRSAAEATTRRLCRREVPVVMKLESGVMVEGIVDLTFKQNNSWIVVDYKTDFELKGRLEEYKHQVGLYAVAIAQASGQNTSAVLLRV